MAHGAMAQCVDTIAPVYSNSCSHDYFESISASGIGVSSTISIGGVTTCAGTDINDFATEGITAPSGTTVTLNIIRQTGYAAYLSVYIDWANTGSYTSGDLAGSMISIPMGTSDTTYSFNVPTTGVVMGTNLHMRLMLSEDMTGAPCTATYGQTYDFFFIAGSGCTVPVLTFNPSSHDTVSNCAGGTGVSITATGAGTGGTFTWAPAAGLSTTTGSTVIANPLTTTVYSVTGTSIYTITGTTTGSCSATYLDTVTVISTGMPADTIYYTGPYTFCYGDTAFFTGTTGPGYSYMWFDNGTWIHDTHNHFYATTSGSYSLVINAYGCIDTSAAVVLTVNPLPAPVITFSGTTFYAGNFYTSYQWFDNGTVISGATTDSLMATANGYYNVLVTDTNGCSDTATTYMLGNLGVNTIKSASGISIYPNPANSVINIVSGINVKAVLTGIEGGVIMEQNNARKMDISHLSAGIYFIELYDDNGSRIAVQKVIKN